jgi:hypothetical protein
MPYKAQRETQARSEFKMFLSNCKNCFTGELPVFISLKKISSNHLQDHKKRIPIPSKKKNWKELFQVFPHNRGISRILLLHLLFGFSQKFSHISDIDIHRSAFVPPYLENDVFRVRDS